MKRLETSGGHTSQTAVPSTPIFTEQMRAGLVELHDKAKAQENNVIELSVNVASLGMFQGEV